MIKKILGSILDSIEGDFLTSKYTLESSYSLPPQKKYIFNDIYGYEDIKWLFMKAITSEKQIHLLLCGPPASAKSLFLQELIRLDNSYYTLGSSSTKSGMVDALFDLEPRFLIIDELEKMPVRDQTVLLSLLEGGIVSETKHRKTRQIRLNTSVFAACNGTEDLLPPLLTRFLVLRLQKYSLEEFREITRRVLYREIGVTPYEADIIVDVVWNKMKSSNVRDCVRVGRLARSQNEILQIVDILTKYKDDPIKI